MKNSNYWLPFDMIIIYSVIRSSVPRMNLDEVFEQKKSIAKSVETELQKVNSKIENHMLTSPFWTGVLD